MSASEVHCRVGSNSMGILSENVHIKEPQSFKKNGATVEQQELYVSAIKAHSLRTKERHLYPGGNFTQLAHFFTTPTPPNGKSPNPIHNRYALFVAQSLSPHASTSLRFFSDTTAHTPTCQLPFPTTGSGQLCFIRGLPTAEWLKLIGAHYRIDPEFFRRHLDFLQVKKHYDLPPLPSNANNMIRLRVCDIFHRQAALTPQQFRNARQEEKDRLQRFQRHLLNRGIAGDSLIRRFSVHNQTTFTVEYSISIYVTGSNKRGWTALVWLDVGNSLTYSSGPWNDPPTSTSAPGIARCQSDCLPITQHRHKLALEQLEPIIQDQPADIRNGMFQSASLLPLNYGKFLHKEAKNSDAMYALSDIFTFVANSENQFLCMMDTNIDEEMEFTVQQKEDTVANLRYNKLLLDDHAYQISDTLRVLETRGTTNWPRSDAHALVVEEKMKSLIIDFSYLLERAKVLARRCAEGIDVLASNAQLEEARKAIQEAEQTRRLTLLAFFYLPLTFTTSIFGMNIRELGQGGTRIWLAIVVGVVVLLLSSVAYAWQSFPWSRTQRKRRAAAAYRKVKEV